MGNSTNSGSSLRSISTVDYRLCDQRFQYSGRLKVVGLAHHADSGYTYALCASHSGLWVSKIKLHGEPDDRRTDLDSFMNLHDKRADLKRLETFMISPKDAKGGINVIGDYLTTYSDLYFKIHDLNGVRQKMVILEGVIDYAGFHDKLYCLIDDGSIAVYSVPELLLVRDLITLPAQNSLGSPTRIACCSRTGQVAILNCHADTVTLYDADFSLLQSIHLSLTPDSVLCLNENEVIVGVGRSVYHCLSSAVVQVALIPSAGISTSRDGLLQDDNITAVCHMDAGKVLVATDNDDALRQLDLHNVKLQARQHEIVHGPNYSPENVDVSVRRDMNIKPGEENAEIVYVAVPQSVFRANQLYFVPASASAKSANSKIWTSTPDSPGVKVAGGWISVSAGTKSAEAMPMIYAPSASAESAPSMPRIIASVSGGPPAASCSSGGSADFSARWKSKRTLRVSRYARSTLHVTRRTGSSEVIDVPPGVPRSNRSGIIGLACHTGTDYVYVLTKSSFGLCVDRLTPYNGEVNLSFKISENLTHHERIEVVGDAILISISGKLLSSSLLGVRLNVIDVTHDVIDVSGTESSVYCLLRTGEVVEYSVPGLEEMRRITPPGQEQGDEYKRIATCPRTQRAAMISVNDESPIVRIYDENWVCLSTAHLPGEDCPQCLVLCEDQLFVTEVVNRFMYYINVDSRSAVRLRIQDLVTGITFYGCDFVLIATDGKIEQLDLRGIRGRGEICASSDGSVVIRGSLAEITEIELIHFWHLHVPITCMSINKITDDLWVISELGHVTVYGRDVARPMEQFTYPSFVNIRRLDTTDLGEVVALSNDDEVMIFLLQELMWYHQLDCRAMDIVTSGNQIIILLHLEVVIYTLVEGRAAEKCRLPFGIYIPSLRHQQDHENNRLAVYGDVVYSVVDSDEQVFRMDLSDPAPSFTTFIQDEDLYPRCVAVTDDGDVVVGGWWRNASGYQDGLRVYSPTGEERRQVVIVESGIIRDIALRPGGGAYIMFGNGDKTSLHFVEHF